MYEWGNRVPTLVRKAVAMTETLVGQHTSYASPSHGDLRYRICTNLRISTFTRLCISFRQTESRSNSVTPPTHDSLFENPHT